MSIEAMKLAFESWARPKWTHREDFDQRIKAKPGTYNNFEVQAAWEAWQAALSQQPATGDPVALTEQHRKAIAICMESCRVSVSEVQRKLALRWNDAQKLCQEIVDAGYGKGLALAPSLNVTHPAPSVTGEVQIAGQALANIAFNLAQNTGQKIEKRWADSMREAYKAWDAAMLAAQDSA